VAAKLIARLQEHVQNNLVFRNLRLATTMFVERGQWGELFLFLK
jgi:hypothetical protein